MPEYVMTMVSNDKSRDGISEAMNPFLKDSCGPFATWLWETMAQCAPPPTARRAANIDMRALRRCRCRRCSRGVQFAWRKRRGWRRGVFQRKLHFFCAARAL